MANDDMEVQDYVSDCYVNIRYKNKYSHMYHKDLYSTVMSLVKNHGLILDNGCGVGDVFEHSPNDNVVGLDFSQGMISMAKARMMYVVRGDTQKLPFRDNSFDSVICKGLLHHVTNKKLAVSEMERVLKENGELIVLEPIRTILSAIPRIMVKDSMHFSSIHGDFKRDELFKLFDDGFTIKSTLYRGYIAYPFLGFPDVVDMHKYIPLKRYSVPILIRMDHIISKLPIFRKQSWAIILRLTKRPNH